MKNKILVLNGTPFSGKDTIADYLVWQHAVCKVMLKNGLCDIGHTLVGMSRPEFVEYCTNRNLKEVPNDKFFGMSPRQFLIHLSEKTLKPAFGKDVLGKICARSIDNHWFSLHGYVFSDGGFGGVLDELFPVIEKFGSHNVIVARIHREGYTFEGDTRAYLATDYLTHYGVSSFDFHNTQSNVDDMLTAFDKKLNNFLIGVDSVNSK